MGDVLEAWTDFNVAMMGAAAALAGLLIVAASVNIAEVIKAVSIPARLAAGLAGLVLAIVGSAIGLVPGIAPWLYGLLTMIAAASAGTFQLQATRHIYANHHPQNRLKWAKSTIGFLAPAAYLVGAILLVAEAPGGEYWFAAGAIAAIIAAILISWIALVEVLR